MILGLTLNAYITTVEVTKVFKRLSEQNLTLNTSKRIYFVTFSITNVCIPMNDILLYILLNLNVCTFFS